MTDRFFALLLLLLLIAAAAIPGVARADAYYAETTGIGQHAEADALAEQARAAGVEAEIVRRFRRGAGWEFLVRSVTTEEPDDAHEYARRLSELSGRSARVFMVAGHDALPVDEFSVLVVDPGGEPSASEQAPADSGENGDTSDERGAELLAAVALAHGGGMAPGDVAGGAQDAGWSLSHCRYERRLTTAQGELRVGHEFWRDGDALRLDVRILEGSGEDSVAIVRGDEEAWLRVGGEVHQVAAGPTREGLLAFAPEVVLGQALAIRTWGTEHPALAVETPAEGGDLLWMEVDPGGGGERLLVGVDPGDHRVRELVVRSGEEEARWRFADYQELGDGMIVPLKSESLSAGEPRERVTIKLIERGEPVEPEVFDPAALKTP